jgi:hypothetical protein
MKRKFVFGAAILLAALSVHGHERDAGCIADRKLVAPRNPRFAADGGFLPGQVILQRSIRLNAETTVRIYEHPYTNGKEDEYDSTIVVDNHSRKTYYRVRDLIKYGESLRIVEFAVLCGSNDQATVVVGFVILKATSASTDVWAMPVVNQGRIVVNKSDPSTVELWSADGNESANLCGACPKHYHVFDCRKNRSYAACTRRSGRTGPKDPDLFMEHRIEIR